MALFLVEEQLDSELPPANTAIVAREHFDNGWRLFYKHT
jgi:hypothetical protein